MIVSKFAETEAWVWSTIETRMSREADQVCLAFSQLCFASCFKSLESVFAQPELRNSNWF